MGRPVDTLRLAGLSVQAFAAVLCFGLLAGAGAFVWTIEKAPIAERRSDRGRGSRDADPAFGSKARQMYALGGDYELAVAAKARRDNLPGDPEGWMFGAFAHERLGAQPGLIALKHRAEAGRLWEGLLEWSRDPMRRWRGSEYYEGWALLGLGHPVQARERFGEHLRTARPSPVGILHYNNACYLAVAGDAERAQNEWRRAALTEMLDLDWSHQDPDLELISGSFEFEVWYQWQRLRREVRRGWRYRDREDNPTPSESGEHPPVFFRAQ